MGDLLIAPSLALKHTDCYRSIIRRRPSVVSEHVGGW